MAFIEPLALETWFISVFSGTPNMFVIIALLVISSMAGYFRMRNISFIFVLVLFMLMFSSYIVSSPLFIMIIIFGGIGLGLAMSRILER